MKRVVAVIAGFAMLIGLGQAGFLRTDPGADSSVVTPAVEGFSNWFNDLIDVGRINREISK